MNPGMTIAQSLVESRLESLKPFPKIVLDILAVLDDEDANANLLVEHLYQDVVLTARLIGLANSATNRQPSQRSVSDLGSAVALLGFSRVRVLVTTLSIRDAFSPDTPPRMAEGFWGHSVDVGTASRIIAEHAGLKPELAYVAGLLHDLGVLWIATHFPAEFERMSLLLEQPEHHIIDLERQLIGTDHAEIGGLLCRLWGLPEDIHHAITGHHQPDGLPANRYVMSVHLAEMASNALNLGKRSRNIVTHLSEQTLPVLGLSWAQIPDLLGEIEARSRFMRVFTGLKSH